MDRSINALPEIDLLSFENNKLSKWKYLTQFAQIVGKNWSSDYLNILQQTSKWRSCKTNINPHIVVLLKEHKIPSCASSIQELTGSFIERMTKLEKCRSERLMAFIKEELRTVLGYEKANLTNNSIHVSFQNYLSEILLSRNNSDSYIVKNANAIVVNDNVDLLLKYKNDVQDFYHASIRKTDFANNADEAVKEINDWVKEKTNGKIENLLEELEPSTLMVLLNAVYFKGKWKVPFDPRFTEPRIFYNNGVESERKTVNTMQMFNSLRFASFDDFQVLMLPYKGENVSFLILLPQQRNGLQALENSLTSEKLSIILDRLDEKRVRVSLPKFKFGVEEDLSEKIQELGANKAFERNAADFSGLTSDSQVFINKVIHKAVIEVNEEGSEAAAATGIQSLRSQIISDNFRADHPFLFAIIETGSKSNMVLFLGRVNNL
ncbi:serpin B8 [Nephila pilipes]|uniref:Serpin B8 n=1 Tax=Nephila pilipes TaxID=299642 RepID=A0A8X6QDN2_NEPPI|nr:serpin B8 [Nephila pilipes]